jgi:hypothetical protein
MVFEAYFPLLSWCKKYKVFNLVLAASHRNSHLFEKAHI